MVYPSSPVPLSGTCPRMVQPSFPRPRSPLPPLASYIGATTDRPLSIPLGHRYPPRRIIERRGERDSLLSLDSVAHQEKEVVCGSEANEKYRVCAGWYQRSEGSETYLGRQVAMFITSSQSVIGHPLRLRLLMLAHCSGWGGNDENEALSLMCSVSSRVNIEARRTNWIRRI